MTYEVVNSFLLPEHSIGGLTWDGTHLRFSEAGYDNIHRIDTNGNVIDDISCSYELGHVACGDNYLWVDDGGNGRILKLDFAGNRISSVSTEEIAAGSVVQGLTWANNHLWVLRKNYIYQLSTNGNVVSGFTCPISYGDIAWDSEYMWAGDRDTGILYQLNLEGDVLNTYPTEYEIRGMTWGGGYLWIANNEYNKTVYQLSFDSEPEQPSSRNVYFYGAIPVEIEKKRYIYSSADLTATANMAVQPHVIANANANITGQSALTAKPCIIANAKSNISSKVELSINWVRVRLSCGDVFGQALLNVKALKLIIPEGAYDITADDYFTKDQPANSGSVANYIIVETQPLRPAQAEEVYRSNEPVSIDAGETISITVYYNSEPCIEPVATIEGAGTISDVNYYTWGADVKVTSSVAGEFELVINAKPLKVQGAEKVFAKDEKSIIENGKIEYTLPANHLIQTKEMAQIIADKLKDSFANPKRDVSLDWRGNPALILADPVSVPEFQKMGVNKIGQFYITSQSLEYNGGLRADLEGRKNE